MSRYVWDREKARANVANHGVSFEEAEAVLDTDLARWAPDPGHAIDTDRFVVTGYSPTGTPCWS